MMAALSSRQQDAIVRWQERMKVHVDGSREWWIEWLDRPECAGVPTVRALQDAARALRG